MPSLDCPMITCLGASAFTSVQLLEPINGGCAFHVCE
jgi:hypothetical protein